MKKTKILSLLLCLSLLCAMFTPGTTAYAGNDPADDDGMRISKTATAKGAGTYTVTLEAYATGEKTISTVTKDVPTDIILVLDLSSSMTQNIGETVYNPYSRKTNEQLYALRHNGGDANLWYYNQEANSYYSVSVQRTGENPNYSDVTSQSNSYLYNNRNNLHALVNGTYVKVTVERTGNWRNYTYTYTYTYNSTSVTKTSTEQNGTPSFDSGVTLHVLTSTDSTNAEYAYSYTDSTGAIQPIITSTGGTANPTSATFYSRSTSTSGGGTRLAALKAACTSFADAVAAKCTATAQHRIAVVGFNSDSTRYTGTSDASALQNMSVAANVTSVKNVISGLETGRGTVPGAGLATANSIFAATPIAAGETRNRVVILFTDGYPSTSGADNFDSSLANAAINQAGIAKNTHGATVYTVAVIAGADPTSAGNANGTNPEKVNWYLQTASSNNGTPRTPSYYLSASDAVSLNNIFQQISQQIETGGSSTTLGSETVVKDIISPYFTLPAGTTASGIQIDTYDCTGKTGNTYTWSNTSGGNGGASATVNGEQVSVTGFDFSANWCGTETGTQGTTVRGKKLVISFTVAPKNGFLGGNDVITNASAGIYENASAQTPIMTFEQPKVNVPINGVAVTAEDKNVYLLGDVTAEQLKEGAEVKVGDINLDLSKASDADMAYGLEPWQTEYVNISVAVKDKEGNAIPAGGLKDLTDDTTYTIEVTVAPKTNGLTSSGTPAATQSGENNPAAKVNVFNPELTYKDSESYYGADVPELSGNLSKTEWKHEGTQDTAAIMLGDKPALDITCTPEADKLSDGKINTKQDIGVDVTVKIGGTDVTNETTFQHTTCADQTCTLPEGKEFLIHIKTCTLAISKAGGADDETYVFDVYKDGVKYSEVTIEGNTTQTLYELPVGFYTVQENTGWSWRYSADNGIAANLSSASPNGSITCTNSSNGKIYWLNGFSQAVRNIFGISH